MGKVELKLVSLSAATLAASALQLVAGLAEKRGLVVRLDAQADTGNLYGDCRRLKQILVNLLSNAVKFTPERGQVGLTVAANDDDDEVRFTVWDTGIGIAADACQRVVEPFVQLESGLARSYGGTGLGLALVRQLTELHGGCLHIESREGEGSRFSSTLPKHWNDVLASTPYDRHKWRMRHVLLVTGEPARCGEIATLLHEQGIATDICGDYDAIHACVTARQADVVLLNALPAGAGPRHLLRQFNDHGETRHKPVIVIGDEKTRTETMHAGASGFVDMTAKREDLLEVMWQMDALLPVEDDAAGNELVLIVDANQQLRIYLANALLARGYRVLQAANGREAIGHVLRTPPDIVFLEVRPNDAEVQETMRQLRSSKSRQATMIAMAALELPGDRERWLAAGADDHVCKPLTLPKLLRLVQTYSSRHAAPRRARTAPLREKSLRQRVASQG